MASWDDEDFEPDMDTKTITAGTDKWEGEDEDEDGLKDNWDDEDEEEDKPKVEVVAKPKKKKTLQEKIKEKEEKKRQEALEREEERKLLEEAERELTPEEKLAAKLEAQRLQEESDLQLAREAFGVTDPLPNGPSIDNMTVSNHQEFEELRSLLVKKLSSFERMKEYPLFLENLFRDLCTSVEHEDIKKISSALTSLAQEKQKAAKAAKGTTKKSKKQTLKTGKGTKNDDYGGDDDYYNEYDDFM